MRQAGHKPGYNPNLEATMARLILFVGAVAIGALLVVSCAVLEA